jgi:CheY-like chemotaxis protein/nitrogen-specific signal transduction histidine kinase
VEFVGSLYTVEASPFILCNIRDISERRQLERARALAEASADLHRRKDEFLAMLSHELRNPLAPIVTAMHLLRSNAANESPVQHKARTIIERQVAHLSHLVNDLLEVSRITTGKIRLHKETIDVRKVVEQAAETVRPLIEQRRHELLLSQPAEPMWLHADPVRIEQVVVNLLNNAAKYTGEGGRLWLTMEQEGHHVVLRVRDTGVGIAPDLLPRIFDLFTQAERSLDRSQGGLGVGLTLVQRLVEIHGGTVEVSSTVGEGSEFMVRLPILQRPAVPPSETPSKAAEPLSRRLRVLVVDDNVDTADSAALLLQTTGHDVRVSYSGQTCLEEAGALLPDVILLDIGLPEMDGYEVARHLRQHPELKNVKLVAMTGHGHDTDRHRSHAAGFDHHLVKPVDPEKLHEILATATDEGA